MNKYIILLGLTAGIMFSSCNIINPDEEIPTYIRIDSIVLEDASGNRMPSEIAGANISYGNNSTVSLVGVFRLPMVIPVLANEPGEIFILPTIDADGMVAQLFVYPYYQNLNLPITPAPGDTLDFGTVVTYPADTFYTSMKDDFEGGTSFEVGESDSVSTFGIQTDVVSEGTYSGIFEIPAPQVLGYIISTEQMYIPLSRNSYIEFDYKSNVDFGVSIIYYSQNTSRLEEYSIIGYRKKENWNKAYIAIDDDLAAMNSNVHFLAFKAFRDTTSSENAKIYLDNVVVKSQL